MNGYIDALATMDSVTSKDGMNLYAGAPLKRQSSIEIFQEHSRFSKWMRKMQIHGARQIKYHTSLYIRYTNS